MSASLLGLPLLAVAEPEALSAGAAAAAAAVERGREPASVVAAAECVGACLGRVAALVDGLTDRFVLVSGWAFAPRLSVDPGTAAAGSDGFVATTAAVD